MYFVQKCRLKCKYTVISRLEFIIVLKKKNKILKNNRRP